MYLQMLLYDCDDCKVKPEAKIEWKGIFESLLYFECPVCHKRTKGCNSNYEAYIEWDSRNYIDNQTKLF